MNTVIKWVSIKLDQPLPEDILSRLSREQLRVLRNEIFARKGRQFDSLDLRELFSKQPWYKPRSDYSDNMLTKIDKENVDKILGFEK
jgi:hypothetical protein